MNKYSFVKLRNFVLLATAISLGSLSTANAGIIRISEAAFTADAGQITFSEFSVGTTNPTYTPGDYGGSVGAPIVTFDGWFAGQGLSVTPGVDCPGAAATACVVGSPTGPLTLDSASPDTFISTDPANPDAPVLSGTPTFNGPIAVLFSKDLAGVGFDGGYFDAVGSTGITAFARDGSLLGTVTNVGLGIEFLGLVTDDGSAQIAGVFLDLVGSEPFGFEIDDLRFGQAGEIIVPPTDVPGPGSFGLALLGLGLLIFAFAKKGWQTGW